MPALKAVLFEAYGGFADKRIKNLDKAITFEVDDRDPGVIGADKKPLTWFCQIHAHALSENEVRVRLSNAPLNERIEKWAENNGAKIQHGLQPVLDVTVNRGQKGLLDDLAARIRAIVGRGARYDTPSYKYSCPRVAKSLEKLKSVLDKAWAPGPTNTEPRTGSLF